MFRQISPLVFVVYGITGLSNADAAPWKQAGGVKRMVQEPLPPGAAIDRTQGLRLQLEPDSEPLPAGSRLVIVPLDPSPQGDDGLQDGRYRLDVQREGQILFRANFLARPLPMSSLRLSYHTSRGFQFRQTLDWPQPVFQKGRLELDGKSEAILAQLAQWLAEEPRVSRLRIAVHTDTGGQESRNLTLTQGRAGRIKHRLIQLGVAPDRLEAVGLGSSEARFPQGTPEQRRQDRRVEFDLAFDWPQERSEG